jgi:hypothetical protein
VGNGINRLINMLLKKIIYLCHRIIKKNEALGMAKYGIPRQLINGFDLIISLRQEDIASLVSILEEAKTGEGIKSISEKLSSQTSLSEDDSIEIMRSIFSMVNIYADSKDSVGKFSEDFISSYKFSLGIEDAIKLESLKNNITKLLPSFKVIKQTIKAKGLIVENANNFIEARIISDIRIVFDDDSDIEKKEQIAVVVHNLRITYSDGGDSDKVFYISLDLSDLSELKDSISRALEKDKLIRIKHHELSFVDVK